MSLVDFYETKNSYYLIDVANLRYMRMAKSMFGRDLMELAELTPALIDDVWLDLEDCENPVEPIPHGVEFCLRIRYAGSNIGILTTPILDNKKIELSEEINYER